MRSHLFFFSVLDTEEVIRIQVVLEKIPDGRMSFFDQFRLQQLAVDPYPCQQTVELVVSFGMGIDLKLYPVGVCQFLLCEAVRFTVSFLVQLGTVHRKEAADDFLSVDQKDGGITVVDIKKTRIKFLGVLGLDDLDVVFVDVAIINLPFFFSKYFDFSYNLIISQNYSLIIYKIPIVPGPQCEAIVEPAFVI